LGCAQLEQLPEKLSDKKRLFARYKIVFEQVKGLRLITEPVNCQSNYWLQTLLLDIGNEHERNAILKATNDAGFVTRPAWHLMDELAPFKSCQKMDLAVAKSLVRRIINIPSSSHLASAIP
jgi:perosamine synthetase